jgi:hypothetical protein
MLAGVIADTRPDAIELVTPPARASSVGNSLSNAAAAAAAPATSPAAGASPPGSSSSSAVQGGLSAPRPPFTLREGVGMRRLLKFHVASGVQLLLVQAASEVYAQHYAHLGVRFAFVHVGARKAGGGGLV